MLIWSFNNLSQESIYKQVSFLYAKKSHTMRTNNLIFWTPSTPACAFLVTSQGVTLPLGARSQPPINQREAVTFPTGHRTLDSILQSVTTDLRPE